MFRKKGRIVLAALLLSLVGAPGCARWVDIRPDQLAVLGGNERGTGAELTGEGQAHDSSWSTRRTAAPWS